jgi:hypothetical protein
MSRQARLQARPGGEDNAQVAGAVARARPHMRYREIAHQHVNTRRLPPAAYVSRAAPSGLRGPLQDDQGQVVLLLRGATELEDVVHHAFEDRSGRLGGVS